MSTRSAVVESQRAVSSATKAYRKYKENIRHDGNTADFDGEFYVFKYASYFTLTLTLHRL